MLSRNWAEPAWQAQDRVQPGELTCVLLSYVLLNNATKTFTAQQLCIRIRALGWSYARDGREHI